MVSVSYLLSLPEPLTLPSQSLLDKLKQSEFSQEILELVNLKEITILPEISDPSLSKEAKALFLSTLERLQNLQHQRNLVEEIINSSEQEYDIELLNLLKDVTLKRDNIESNVLDQDKAVSDSGNSEQNEDRERLEKIIASVSPRGNSINQSTKAVKTAEVTRPPNENEMVMDNSHRISKKDYIDLQNLVGE